MKFELEQYITEIESISNLEEFKIGLDNCVFLIDSNVWTLYKGRLSNIVSDHPIFYITAKEDFKSLKQLAEIYRFFTQNNVNRSTTIIAIGGGITTDLSAYAASTFKRGCKLWLIPTTLLAMVDAALGGKTAINFENLKNCIGTFYPAEKVIIFTGFVDSLVEVDYLSGMAEVIKTSLVAGGILRDLLTQKELDLSKMIDECVKVKLGICQKDLYDQNERRLLNLGHTFAHVIETCSDFKIKHGIAVSMGLRLAAKISLERKTISSHYYDYIIDLLNSFKFPKKLDINWADIEDQRIANVLMQDKKNEYSLQLILLQNDTAYIEQNVITEDIIRLLKQSNNLF